MFEEITQVLISVKRLDSTEVSSVLITDEWASHLHKKTFFKALQLYMLTSNKIKQMSVSLSKQKHFYAKKNNKIYIIHSNENDETILFNESRYWVKSLSRNFGR